MKILIDLTALADNFSGIERFAMSITKKMICNKNNKFILIFKNEVHEEFKDYYENVDKIVIKGKNKLFFNQVILPIYLMKYKADFYLFLAFPAPFLFFNKKSINTIHDLGCWDCPQTNKKHMIYYFRILYWKASLNKKKIITVSEFSKRRIIKILNVSEKNISVVYNGLSDHLRQYNYNLSKAQKINEIYNIPEKYILSLSTLEPRKNIRLLIMAFKELIEEGLIDYNLVLVGRKGWMIDDLITGLPEKIAKKIFFTGFIKDELLPEIYSKAEVFVFPSLYEGFGVPPIEAMSVGTNVISSDAASLPEILKDSVIYFKNKDKESLKEKLIQYSNLSNLERKKMISKGILISHRYTWEKAALLVEGILGKEREEL